MNAISRSRSSERSGRIQSTAPLRLRAGVNQSSRGLTGIADAIGLATSVGFRPLQSGHVVGEPRDDDLRGALRVGIADLEPRQILAPDGHDSCAMGSDDMSPVDDASDLLARLQCDRATYRARQVRDLDAQGRSYRTVAATFEAVAGRAEPAVQLLTWHGDIIRAPRGLHADESYEDEQAVHGESVTSNRRDHSRERSRSAT